MGSIRVDIIGDGTGAQMSVTTPSHGRVAERSGPYGRMMMLEKRTIAKARKDKRAGKAPSTQAGEFVHEEIRKIRRGEHGARSPQQAIAIGLSKARRAGVALRPPRRGQAKARTRRSAEYAYAAGQHKRKIHRRPRVSRASLAAVCRGPRSRARPDAPLRAVPRLRAPLRREKRCGRKAPPAAPLQHIKRHAPERDIAGSGNEMEDLSHFARACVMES
jgi:hypothetical protein